MTAGVAETAWPIAGGFGFPGCASVRALVGYFSFSPRSGLPFFKKRSEKRGFPCRLAVSPPLSPGSVHATHVARAKPHTPMVVPVRAPCEKRARPNWASARAEGSKSVKTDKNDKNCVSGGLCACRPTNFKNALSTGRKSPFFHVFFLPSLLFLRFVAPLLSGEVHVELRRRFC